MPPECAIIEQGFQYDRINGENKMNQQKSIGALVCLCLLLGGCGRPTIGEQQAFNPNLTVGESETRELEQSAVEVLKLPCDYNSLTASPWNCTDWNSRKAATLLYDSPVRLSDSFQAQPDDRQRLRNPVGFDRPLGSSVFRRLRADREGCQRQPDLGDGGRLVLSLCAQRNQRASG